MSRNELTATEAVHLPAITPAAPVAAMLSLPAWLESLVIAVSRDSETNAPIWQRVPILPENSLPTSEQRSAIAARIEQLSRMEQAYDERRAVSAITKMLMFYATTGMSEEQAAIRGEVYSEAVSDIPGWAVDEAVNRWFKGQAGVPTKNYDFAPSPALLREIAERVLKLATGQRVLFTRILAAQPAPAAISEERKAKMAERVRRIIADAADAEGETV